MRRRSRRKVLLPVLGDQYGLVLENGEIALRFEPQEGSFSAWYYDHRFPIAPRSYPMILEAGGEALAVAARGFAAIETREDAARLERSLRRTAPAPATGAQGGCGGAAGIRRQAGRPEHLWRLHRLLEIQTYRIAYWRVAAEEINYRRFFNINDLAGLRMELPASVRARRIGWCSA